MSEATGAGRGPRGAELRAARLPPYGAALPFTYAFGRFALHEALRWRPEDVELVLWHAELPEAARAELLAAAAAAGVRAQQDDATVARLRRHAAVRCLAVVRKREERLTASADHVLLMSPSHPGNVGTLVRSLVAFGFHDLALVGSRVDPWAAYVVRASVGLRFALRCQEFASVAEYVERFPQHALYRFDAGGEVTLEEAEFVPPFTLLFGPEWREQEATGAPHTGALGAPAVTVRIPHDRQVESLNLAVSVSVAAYATRRLAR